MYRHLTIHKIVWFWSSLCSPRAPKIAEPLKRKEERVVKSGSQGVHPHEGGRWRVEAISGVMPHRSEMKTKRTKEQDSAVTCYCVEILAVFLKA